MKQPVLVLAFACAGAVILSAQGTMAPRPMPPAEKPMTTANPLTQSTMAYYTSVKGWLTRSAEMMPDTQYSFRPDVKPSAGDPIRTFGRLIAHVADGNYLFCGAVNAKAPTSSIESTATLKADIGKALAASFAFCDKAWAATTDANAATPLALPEGLGPNNTRLGVLVFNTNHLAEHYGNVVTYLRANGMVPPSTTVR